MTTKQDNYGLGSIARMKLIVPSNEIDNVILAGLDNLQMTNPSKGGVVEIRGERRNAFVNQGLQRALDLLFEDTQGALTGISHIGLSADATTVDANTVDLDPGAAGSSIKAVTNVSRTNQTMHGEAAWTQADVAFAIRKIGFLYGPATTDVVNIIGGAGGVAPYDEDFTVDLTNVSSWALTFGIDLTASAS